VRARAAGCLLLAAAAGAACNIRDARLSGAALPCSSSTQCSSDSVCFLGECRGSSAQLSLVLAEVRAPGDQQLGLVQRARIDLRQSALVDFQLQPLLSASGTVQQDPGPPVPVAGASVVLTDAAPVIGDRVTSLAVQTDAAGAFSLTFPASTWNVLVLPPPSAPPFRPAPPASPLASTTSGLQIVLPAQSQLTPVAGTLLAGGVPLIGARVSAVDASGQPLSGFTTTDSAGAFGLQLPPGPPQYFLQIGPDSSITTDPAVPAFPLQGPFSTPAPAPDVGPLPDPATLTGTVLDVSQQPVAAARVLALSIDATGWVISRQIFTDAHGAFALAVRTGLYVVEAAPGGDPTLPGLSGEVEWSVPAGGPLTLVCPPKSQGSGAVTRPDGQRVGAGYQIAAMRLPDRLVNGRPARAAATDASGAFTLVGDPGHYRLEVVPPAATGLPRKIVSVELGSSAQVTQLPVLQLSPALTVVGTVTRTGLQPVGGATVDFFALDASGGRSVLIGSGLSDSAGRYQVVLPDVPAPADQPP